MSKLFTWNEGDHPRGVLGRFEAALKSAKVGDKFELQDGSASVHVASSKTVGLRGPNRKVYKIKRKDGTTTSAPAEHHVAVAKHALDQSAKNEGKLSLGPSDHSYEDVEAATKAHEDYHNTHRIRSRFERKPPVKQASVSTRRH